MEDLYKEVFFCKYCGVCKHADIKDFEEPCNECLENTYNIQSHKPVNFEIEVENK